MRGEHEVGADKKVAGALAEHFGLAPFSVLSARSGWWQRRKRAWIGLGIQSELGRGENLLNFSDSVSFTGDTYNERKAQRARANKSASFRDQDKSDALRSKTPGRRRLSGAATGATAGARPSAKNLYKFKTPEGYKSGAEVCRDQDASLKSGLAIGTTCDGTDPQTVASATGTSIFDPVICEIIYRWFCPPRGVVLDPFAGGSVRGVVASKLGRRYLGIDLSTRQVEANREQARQICDKPFPVWTEGDSLELSTLYPSCEADLVFSCPPYADLEVYSDDPRDLSTMSYEDFLDAYFKIIAESCALLRPDRFACFVVGDLRDDKGFYRSFPGHTIEAFEDAGLRLYNEAVLVTAVGSLPLRVGRAFTAARKLGKSHQNILIFCKGDPRRATEAVGPVDFGEISTLEAGQSPPDMRDQVCFL